MAGSEIIRTAGGVVARRTGDGEIEVLLVRSRRTGDWTFPKGKALPGEPDETCARREVEEETGLRCALEEELPGATYRDRKGRQRIARYWAMSPVAPGLPLANEVDSARWVLLESAGGVLTYAHDRALLTAFARRRPRPGPGADPGTGMSLRP
jgi:8-oxo-dGTP diphosphatase